MVVVVGTLSHLAKSGRCTVAHATDSLVRLHRLYILHLRAIMYQSAGYLLCVGKKGGIFRKCQSSKGKFSPLSGWIGTYNDAELCH